MGAGLEFKVAIKCIEFLNAFLERHPGLFIAQHDDGTYDLMIGKRI